MPNKTVRFIDLFAGIGGIRTGLTQALNESGFEAECVMTSEIKPYAIKVLKENYAQDNIVGDSIPRWEEIVETYQPPVKAK